MISITPNHNVFRLTGSLQHLSSGSGTPGIQIYTGTRPATASDVPTSEMLVVIPLTKPAGIVDEGLLRITAANAGFITATGTPTWARFVTGDGETCFDADVGFGPGEWEVSLDKEELFAGGEVFLLSALFG
jgi:hypothetical protein